jgi:hypothetical protein
MLRAAAISGALPEPALDVVTCQDAVDEEDDGLAVALGELLKIAEALEERDVGDQRLLCRRCSASARRSGPKRACR